MMINYNFSKTHKYFFFGILIIALLFPLSQFLNLNNLDRIFWDKLEQVNEIETRQDITIIAIDDESLSKIGAWPWDRKNFGEIINILDKNKAKVIAYDITFLESRENDLEFQNAIDTTKTPIILASKISKNKEKKPIFNNAETGSTNIIQDNDGIVRTMLLYIDNAKTIPSFAQQIYISYTNNHPRKKQLLEWNQSLKNKNEIIFSKTNFNIIPAHKLLSNSFDKSEIKDHIILIGSTAKDLHTGLVDNISKIGGIRISGVELHAHFVSALLNKAILTHSTPLKTNTLLISLLILLLILFRKIKHFYIDVLISVIVSISLIVLSVTLFSKGILIPTITYILMILIIPIYSLINKYIQEKNSKEFISKAFKQYMNPELLHSLLEHPEQLKLGGEKRDMTILFSDIRSFTTLSEKLSAEELVSLLNAYLDNMSHVIFDHAGIIDKFIGDAIMAFWNAPITDEHHAMHGVLTAIAMSKALREFNAQHIGPHLRVGIGVHTGEVIVGNMGSTKRFDYTLIGDNVNLSARLEGLTKKYGVEILLSQETVEDVKQIPHHIIRKIDTVIVKGKTLPISIFEPMPNTPVSRTKKEIYERGFIKYQAGQFKEAITILKENKNDKPSELLINRINEFKQAPENWDGVWKWTSK